MKTCKSCDIEKPVTDYWKYTRSADGFQYTCKQCQNKQRAKLAREKRLPKVEEMKARKREIVESRHKDCRMCGKNLSKVANFSKSKVNADGYSNRCRACSNEWQTRVYMARKLDPVAFEKRQIHYTRARYRGYGTTIEEVSARIELSNNCCEICSQDFGVVRMNVDHFHDIGGLRGVLCDPCNRGLGFFKDSPELMFKAFKYLENSYSLRPNG